MACTPVTFHGVSGAVFNCLKLKLKDGGITVPEGDSGEISGHGITADFVWDAQTQTLQITVTEKPFFISCGKISGSIHDEAVACGGQ